MSDDTLVMAQSYARWGWPVFRIHPDSKIPTDRWVHGGPHGRATTDPYEVNLRWGGDGVCTPFNIGIATGYPIWGDGRYLTVLDLDNVERPDWAIPTYEVRTPSGGLHLYYVTDEPVKSSAGQLGVGIDVRSRGGMVVAPPSSIGGQFYVVERDPGELPTVPVPRFLPISRNQGTSSVPYDGVRSPSPRGTVLKQPGDIQPGERHSQLMANGAAIYAAAESAEAARYTIETFNQMMPEPLSPREVKNIADWLEARENWL